MKHIPFQSARIDEVKETTAQSKRIPQEHGSTFAGITYDLPTVKIEQRAQNEEPNKFKDDFIMSGAFYVEGSIFSAIDELVEGSGSSYLLTETRVIVSGYMDRLLQ